MTPGRETSGDVRRPRTTTLYKGNRSQRWSSEESAGLIVLLEGWDNTTQPEGRSPTSVTGVQCRGGGFDCRMARNKTPTVRQLQRTLYRKAKQDKAVKFYSLYDKVWREDGWWEAWAQGKAKHGAPGGDGGAVEGIGDKVQREW